MFLDLTHTICGNMPVYPGTASPRLEPANTLAEHGFRETLLTLTSHTGTHMDAPAHLFETGASLDTMDIDRFCGRARVLDCRALGPGRVITAAFLAEQALTGLDFVLFYTGFEEHWGKAAFFGPFAVPDEGGAAYLASLGLKGVGTDAISIDPMEDESLTVHRILLGAGLVNVENLRLGALVGAGVFHFFALPLKFEHADGGPVRALAKVEEDTEG